MKFGMSAFAAVLVAGFFVLEAPAQETIQSSGTVVIPSDYRVVQQPTRTGLFGRLRNRNNMATPSMPTMVSPPITSTASVVTPPKTMPSGIIQASGTTTTPVTPVIAGPASATTNAPVMMEQNMQQPRQGLFARLRARRGM